jgi:hypothetical protein
MGTEAGGVDVMSYTLMETLRRVMLAGIGFATARGNTLRLKLLNIGAVVVRNTRRAKILLSSVCPYQAIFTQAALNSG